MIFWQTLTDIFNFFYCVTIHREHLHVYIFVLIWALLLKKVLNKEFLIQSVCNFEMQVMGFGVTLTEVHITFLLHKPVQSPSKGLWKFLLSTQCMSRLISLHPHKRGYHQLASLEFPWKQVLRQKCECNTDGHWLPMIPLILFQLYDGTHTIDIQ